jgi:hypothetical protein
MILFVAVMCRVRLGSLRSMMRGVLLVTARGVRMVGGLFMRPRLMMFGRFLVMVRGFYVVICCVAMMAGCFIGHRVLLSPELAIDRGIVAAESARESLQSRRNSSVSATSETCNRLRELVRFSL